MEEKFGTIIIDGKLVDVDKLSLEELKKLKKEVEEKEKNIREKINNILNEDDER